MNRAAWLVLALAGAIVVGFLASLPPAALPTTAPEARFSADRAMADVRTLASAPRPTGSAEAARARAFLVARLRGLGLEVSLQEAPLSDKASNRLRQWRLPDQAPLTNIVGRLPGADPTQPAVALMAHYDSVAGSPGAADDAAGVASILEVLRALKAGPAPRRDVVVVLSDAEELNLDGAEAFFARHPLAARVGVVVNLEARGGGGRALMFETGAGNGAMMGLFARSVAAPSAHSLSVLIYRLMPNSSDFTVAKDRGLPGFNFAFMGGAWQYHSPLSTPEALSRGSLQHMGGQALDLTRALAQAEALPERSPDAVFSDVLGRVLAIYPAAAGWALLAVAGLAVLVVCVRLRREGALDGRALAGGFGAPLALMVHAVLALDLFNRLSGAGPRAEYFDRLAALPRLEVQAVLVGLAVILGVLAWRPRRRGLRAAPALLLAACDIALGAAPIPAAALAVVAGGTFAALSARRGAGEWLGGLILLWLIGVAVQAAAPTAAPLVAWPLVAASLGALAASLIDPALASRRSAIPVVIVAVVAGGQVLAMAHLAFLGVGSELANAMAAFAVLLACLVQPLVPTRVDRRLGVALAVLLVVAAGLALSVRLDPPAASAPAWR